MFIISNIRGDRENYEFSFGAYRSGPFKRRVSNNRRSQIRAGGKSRSKLITAGSQISAGGGQRIHFKKNVMSGLHIFSNSKLLVSLVP